MNKVYILFLIFSALFHRASAQSLKNNKQGFIFSGKVIGMSEGYVYIYYADYQGIFIHDSCKIKNEEFTFQGQISHPTKVLFYGAIKSRDTRDPNTTDIYIEPGENHGIFFQNQFKNGKVSGSTTHNEFMLLRRVKDALANKYEHALTAYNTALQKRKLNIVDSIYKSSISKYLQKLIHEEYNFILTHPNSYVSIYLIQHKNLSADSLRLFLNTLSFEIQDSRIGQKVLRDIEIMYAVNVGMVAPEFSQPDPKGNLISLKDFSGKYILLEFWASWCVPCRKENPLLRRIYKKYSSKNFTIIGISLDKESDRAKWIKAIKEDELKWPQISDLKGIENVVAKKYAVGPIPSNFLIDPKGTIIGKNLRGVDLENFLDQTLE